MSKKLDLSLEHQKCTQWCWAAVTLAIGTFFNDDATFPSKQCALANDMVGARKNCCTDCHCETDPFDTCNRSINLGVVLANYRYGRDGSSGVARLTFDEVRDEIEDEHPIAVSIKLQEPAAPSHAIVIFGYTDDETLNIADPMQAGTQISATLDELLNGTSTQLHGTWEAAFRTKRHGE